MAPFEEARTVLRQALAQTHTLHLKGARALHRARLQRVLSLTASLPAEMAPAELDEMRMARLLAQEARAHDARHGAGQLSRSAQRAPTEDACEAGWRNVEGIVRGAEEAAEDASALANALRSADAHEAARRASDSAAQAREIVTMRNHAYTFHADPAFSFGEGWYVAAAGVLCGVRIQVEPNQVQTLQALRFLQDAGLTPQPYRSRPRANKALPALIAEAFRHDPTAAQLRVRRAFLGEGPPDPELVRWAKHALEGVPVARPKVLVWVREGVHDAHRNTAQRELDALCALVDAAGGTPLLFGDAPKALPSQAVDLTLCWKLHLFQGAQMRRAQLQLFEALVQEHGVVGQVGVTTAGMDGPALLGLPTMYLTEQPNPRLGRWVGAVPGYQEVVRTDDLGDVEATLASWCSRATATRS